MAMVILVMIEEELEHDEGGAGALHESFFVTRSEEWDQSSFALDWISNTIARSEFCSRVLSQSCDPPWLLWWWDEDDDDCACESHERSSWRSQALQGSDLREISFPWEGDWDRLERRSSCNGTVH